MVIGLLVFNNRGEFRKVISNLKPRTVYSKGSKEPYGEVNESGKVSAKEIAQESREKIPETQKTAGDKETIQQVSFQKKYVVVIESANIRRGPGVEFPTRSVAKKGEIIENLDDKQKYWIKIKTQDGEVGWISKNLLEEIDR
jgi:uncharacterized protein YgiM (DUF1202 family)